MQIHLIDGLVGLEFVTILSNIKKKNERSLVTSTERICTIII